MEIYLIIDAGVHDPDEVTKILGVHPSSVRKKGERREGSRVISRFNLWRYHFCDKHQMPSASQRKAIAKFLKERMKAIESLPDDMEVSLAYVYYCENDTGDVVIDRKILEVISGTRVSILLNNY